MAFLSIPNVAIRGIAACVPPKIQENRDIPFYTREEAEKVIATTGVERRHVVSDGITASDLCLKACEKLIDELGWEAESIDLICNVTQTSDYINHPNVFVLHEKLGLKQNCMALDLFHGCPGWVMGMSTVASLMSHGTLRRGIMLDGDCITRTCYAYDRESVPLFGDCGTATAFEYTEEAASMLFHTGTISADGKALAREIGGHRNPFTVETFIKDQDKLSGKAEPTADDHLMDGMSVFSFGITVPPKSIKQLCEHYGKNMEEVDKVILHQGNLFMVNKIAKKLKVAKDKVPSCLGEYGNTTSTSIPLTIVSQCRKEYEEEALKTIACGYGTGLSWGTVYLETSHIKCPEVIIY